MVHVLPPQGQADGRTLEREFRTFPRDLRNLRGWLKNCGVNEAVMESTGQYWRAVWNILEGAVPKLVLVHPAHVKALAGRKTDRIDACRLARYLENGDLDGSLVPPREVREWRDWTRWRVHLTQEVNRVKNRMGQMCEAGNIQVSSVASDLFGASGRRMLQAMVEGKGDAGWMADYAYGRLRTKRKELAPALDGTFTEHQRWMLGQELQHLQCLESQIGEAEKEITLRMQPYAEWQRRLMTIPGVDRMVGWTILAEWGPDMGVFPDADHAASWGGLCPGNRQSGGKRLSGRTRKANPYLRRALTEAAWAASHTQNSYLAALYYRLRGRLGHNQAIFAVAHQMLRVAYTMLRRGEDYGELGGDYYDRKNKPRVVHRLAERLSRRGYPVQLQVSTASAGTAAENRPEPPTTTRGTDASLSAEPPREVKPRRGRPCKCVQRGVQCTHGRNKSEPEKTQPIENART